MKFTVHLISFTMPDWAQFVKICQEIYGVSPTRDLDSKHITVGDPGSFAMAIEVLNNRPEAVGDLSKGYRGIDFIHFSFLVHTNDSEALEGFCNLLDITHLQFSGRDGKVLLCGSVRQLKDAISCGCEIEQYRGIFNRMHDILVNFGFKSLFGMKQCKEDGSFTLLN